MTGTSSQLDAAKAKAVAMLKDGHESMPWPQRRALVKAVADELQRSGPRDVLTSLMMLLADDPKWEVRSDVADCLLLIDADEFAKLAARLSEDDNAFVRQAAQRALDRRRRGRESSQRKRRGLDHVQDQYDSIEQTHGSVAAQRARAMAEQLYDILVGATVHDMRNVLAPLKSAISGLLGHLADGKFDARIFEKNLVKMGHQAEVIERMLEDMRTYAQPTPALRRRERLADMVREAFSAVLDTLRATGRDASCVKAEIDVPENLTVDAARFDMVRALMNLIKNAYESHATSPDTFTPGSVWVTARPVNGERIEIIFRDDGMGLSTEELDDVRRFVPGGTSKKTYGTGFGLPTAKRKIEAHGGALAIESEVDQGTTVTVTLPIESEGSDDSGDSGGRGGGENE
jgi:signal transduction histidine kinase